MDIILSICIPTYNRANTLKLTLESIRQQIQGYVDKVEVCISDNCSDDQTEEIVRKYQDYYLIQYHRMDNMKLPVLNWDYTIRHMAVGKYVLMIGDDDIFINDGIGRLICLLENGDQDYYYLNHCHKQVGEIQQIVFNNNCKMDIKQNECECFRLEDAEVEKWEEILTWDGKFQDINMLFIGNHLMKPEIWKSFDLAEKVGKLQKNDEKGISDWFYQTWSPQVEIVASGMMSKSCGYVGMPIVLQGLGVNDNNLSARIILMQRYWFHIFKELEMDKTIFQNYKEYIDKKIIFRFHYLMTYQKGILEKYPEILEYIYDNIKNPDFFEEIYHSFSNFNNDYFYKISTLNLENDIKKIINEKKGKIVLWGTGDIAKKIWESSPTLRDNINYVVDGSTVKQGTIYEENLKIIMSPDTLINYDVVLIIIATLGHQNEIIEYIREKIKKPVHILCQYGIMEE